MNFVAGLKSLCSGFAKRTASWLTRVGGPTGEMLSQARAVLLRWTAALMAEQGEGFPRDFPRGRSLRVSAGCWLDPKLPSLAESDDGSSAGNEQLRQLCGSKEAAVGRPPPQRDGREFDGLVNDVSLTARLRKLKTKISDMILTGKLPCVLNRRITDNLKIVYFACKRRRIASEQSYTEDGRSMF